MGDNSSPMYDDYVAETQQRLDKPMPLIGVYIAAASLVCTVAMAGDVIYGIRRRKQWFPSKFFTVNAASLTVLAVAMKLPVDLTTGMWGTTDVLAKVSSNVFLTTVLGNFLTSFAAMDDSAIFLNVTALGVLVVTFIVNVCIYFPNADITVWAEEIFVIIATFVLFLTTISSALTIPTTKRHLELKYNELHKTISNGGKPEDTGKLTDQELKEVVEKYWVMAESSSPQFVMARSVTSATSGVICVLTALTLVCAAIRFNMLYSDFDKMASNYKWSTQWILWIQFIGVVVGTVAPTFRWFTAISFNCSNRESTNPQKESKLVEHYWIQRLVEWKERPLTLQIRGVKCRKLVHNTKNLFLDLCIGIQFVVVVACKAILFVSVIFVSPLFWCSYYCMRLKRNCISDAGAPAPVNPRNLEPEASGTELDLNDYVLQLEGEVKLPRRILTNICHDLNQMIEMGKRQNPKNLMELLRKCTNNFKGVAQFDSSQVPDLLLEKPLTCWTLPVVTLTSIAIAIPNIQTQMVDSLVTSVSEGLLYVGLVEEAFGSYGDNLFNLKQAGDIVWVGIELYRKWLDKDLKQLALKGKTSEETLHNLTDMAEKTVQRSMAGSSKVLAANSMHRVSRTILKAHESNADHTDEELFEELSIMIADILGACLTNLPHVISRKCYCSAIEERESSVRCAARLLGETEAILDLLRPHQLPSLTGNQAAYINEWRAFMMQENPSSVVSSSNNEMAASNSGELHISVDE